MTGHESENRALWMTTDRDYATSYSTTGIIVEIVMPRSTLFQIQQNNMVIQHNGIDQIVNQPMTEYLFTPPVASQIIQKYTLIP